MTLGHWLGQWTLQFGINLGDASGPKPVTGAARPAEPLGGQAVVTTEWVFRLKCESRGLAVRCPGVTLLPSILSLNPAFFQISDAGCDRSEILTSEQ